MNAGQWVAFGCAVYTADRWENGNNAGRKFVCSTIEDPTGDEMPTDADFERARVIALLPDMESALVDVLCMLGTQQPLSEETHERLGERVGHLLRRINDAKYPEERSLEAGPGEPACEMCGCATLGAKLCGACGEVG